MKFQALTSVLFAAAPVLSHSVKAHDSPHAPERIGNWFSMAFYPQVHNATYDSTFNMTYYNDEQMPFVYELWKPFGMKGYTINTFGLDAPYSVFTLMYFDTEEQFNAAFAAHGEEIFARVPLFSSEYPPHYVGQVFNITV